MKKRIITVVLLIVLTLGTFTTMSMAIRQEAAPVAYTLQSTKLEMNEGLEPMKRAKILVPPAVYKAIESLGMGCDKYFTSAELLENL